jgi:hypothetical protein
VIDRVEAQALKVSPRSTMPLMASKNSEDVWHSMVILLILSVGVYVIYYTGWWGYVKFFFTLGRRREAAAIWTAPSAPL